jgi:hypothetical protein
MASLTAAHRGFERQELLVHIVLVDMLLGTVVQVQVDEKLTLDDRFDDRHHATPLHGGRYRWLHASAIRFYSPSATSMNPTTI